MAYGQIDEIDLVSLIALPLFAGVELGVWTLSINTFNFGFSDVLVTVGGTDITIAMVGALAAIGALVAQGQLDQGDFQDEEWYVIAGSLVALPLYRFVPAVKSIVDSTPIVAFILWIAISAAAIFISYKG